MFFYQLVIFLLDYAHILFLVCNTKLCLGGSAKKTFVVGHSHSTALCTRTTHSWLNSDVVGRWFRRTWRSTRCRTCGTACQRGSRSTRRSSTTGRRPRALSSKVRHKVGVTLYHMFHWVCPYHIRDTRRVPVPVLTSRIHKCLGLRDPELDPAPEPDPSINKQKL
jgi:hypothetical protein